MIIPINISLPSDTSDSPQPKLPPSLAKLGSAEVVLIELQGTLEVEGAKDKQMIGKLNLMDVSVLYGWFFVLYTNYTNACRTGQEADADDWPPLAGGQVCEPTEDAGSSEESHLYSGR
jgi:hypothetical protein